MIIFISNLKVTKLHGLYDIDISLNKGTNIIYGANGSGKTTIIHILSNAINQDWERFVRIEFEEIVLSYSDNSKIKINQWKKGIKGNLTVYYKSKKSDYQTIYSNRIGRNLTRRDRRLRDVRPKKHGALYIPAFRTLLDASPFAIDLDDTQLARQVYGEFVPAIDIYSYKNIVEKIDEEIRESISKIIKRDSALLQRLPILRNQLAHHGVDLPIEQASDITVLFDEIKEYPVYIDETIIDDVNSTEIEIDRPLLLAYQQTWQEMLKVRKEQLETLNKLFNSLNKFLRCKKIQYSPATSFENDPPFIEVMTDDKRVIPLNNGLSSGERQLFTILFASTRLAGEKIVLIDEPEISLGTFWQSQLLKESQKLLSDKQLIVCTHSVEIGESFSDDHVIVLEGLGCETYEQTK